MKLNYFEKRALDLIAPYRYDDASSVEQNTHQEYIIKSLNQFDYLILPIGLIMLKLKQKHQEEK